MQRVPTRANTMAMLRVVPDCRKAITGFQGCYLTHSKTTSGYYSLPYYFYNQSIIPNSTIIFFTLSTPTNITPFILLITYLYLHHFRIPFVPSILRLTYLMKIDLYLDYISQPSRAVLAFCYLSSIPINIHQIRIAKLQHLTPEFSSVNPMRKVPAIVDQESSLSIGESHAIMGYLMRKYKKEEQWGEKEIVNQARIEEYLHYHHQNTRKCALLLYSEVFSKLYPVDQNSIPSSSVLRLQIQRIFNILEEHYFKESIFLIGTRLTRADLAAFFEIFSLVVVGWDFKRWPKISCWVQTVEALQEVRETNKNFMRLLPKLKPKI